VTRVRSTWDALERTLENLLAHVRARQLRAVSLHGRENGWVDCAVSLVDDLAEPELPGVYSEADELVHEADCQAPDGPCTCDPVPRG
jgi:hypothetical protein